MGCRRGRAAFTALIIAISSPASGQERFFLDRPEPVRPETRECDREPPWRRGFDARISQGDGYCLGHGAAASFSPARAVTAPRGAARGLGPLHPARGLFVAYGTDCEESNMAFLSELLSAVRPSAGVKINVLVFTDEIARFRRELSAAGHRRAPSHLNVIETPQKPALWIQDVMEAGVDDRGHAAILDLAYGTSDRGASERGDAIPRQIAGACRDDLPRLTGPRTFGDANSGGALEFLPGGLLAGTGTSRDLTRWLGTPAIDSTAVNTRWLDVGHLDEIVAVVPSNRGRCGAAVVMASPSAAFTILRREPTRTVDTPLPSPHALGRAWHRAPTGCLGDIPLQPTRASTRGSQLFWCPDFIEANERYETLIEAEARRVKRALEAGLGCSGAEIVRLPALFRPTRSQSTYGGASDHAFAMTPNPANLVVLGSQALVPRQFHSGLTRGIRDALEGLGLRVSFLDDRFYHFRGGNLHCGTQVLRAPH